MIAEGEGLTINRIIEEQLQTMWTTWDDCTLMLYWGLETNAGTDTEDSIGARRIKLFMGIVEGIGIALIILTLTVMSEKIIHLCERSTK